MFSADELINSLITEMYELFKALVSGNYAGFCTLFNDMISKLAALREGVKKDSESKDEQVKRLEENIRTITGDETYRLSLDPRERTE